MNRLFLMAILVSFNGFAQDINYKATNNQKFKFLVQGGYSYRTAKVPETVQPDFSTYLRNLKSGANIGLNLNYFFGQNWGLGLKYSHFTTNGSASNAFVGINSNGSVYGKVKDKIRIDFIGPAYVGQMVFGTNQRHLLSSGVSVGLLGYKDEGNFGNNDVKITGKTFGATIDFGYDFGISENFFLGLKSGLYAGVLTKRKVETYGSTYTEQLDENSQEGLGRLDINLALTLKL